MGLLSKLFVKKVKFVNYVGGKECCSNPVTKTKSGVYRCTQCKKFVKVKQK